MKKIWITILLAAVLMAVVPLATVNADQGNAEAGDTQIIGAAAEGFTNVTANILVPILIDGREMDGAVQSVPIGSNVCISTNMKYTRTDERYRFSSWQHKPVLDSPNSIGGGPAATDRSLANECIVVTEGGTYIANYVSEVLFQVRSGVDAYKQSRWVERDTIVDLAVPEIVEGGENVRYRFSGWNGGESPFTPENRIAVLAPMVLELGWIVEYNMVVEDADGNLSPASGWYRSNDILLIRTPEEIIKDGGREKLTFKNWEVVYGPILKNDTNAAMAVLVDGPCLLRPIYTESFLVEAETFQGILFREWVQRGEEIQIEAPALVAVTPDRERYVFTGWEGKEGLEGNELDLIIDSALSLEAIYQRQFMLNVRSPYGASGDGWYDEGEKAIIMAPEEPQSMLFFKRSFDGFLGYGNEITLPDQPVTTVQINEPMTVTAVYRSEINPKVLFLLIGVLTIGTLAYAGTEWGPKVYRRMRRREVEVPAMSDEMKRLLAGTVERAAPKGI